MMNSPADDSLSVSPGWLAAFVNKQLVFYDRNQNNAVPPDGSADLWTFFGLQPQIGFDVTIAHDPLLDRFIATTLGGPNLSLAYSDIGDPIPLGVAGTPGSAWDKVTTSASVLGLDCDITAPENLYLDQPKVGIDADAWYVSSANDQLPQGADRQVQVFHVFKKPTGAAPAMEVDEVYSRDFIGPDLQPLGCSQLIGIQGGKGRELAFPA
jgi:hypothetical protein